MKNKFKMFLLLISIFFVFMISYNVKAAITIIDEQHIDGLIGKIEYDSSKRKYTCSVINDTHPVGSIFTFKYVFHDIGDAFAVKINEANQILMQTECSGNSQIDELEVMRTYEENQLVNSININDFEEPYYYGKIVRTIIPNDDKIESINIKYYVDGSSDEVTKTYFSAAKYIAEFTVKLADGYILDFEDREYSGITKINGKTITPNFSFIDIDTYVFQYKYNVTPSLRVFIDMSTLEISKRDVSIDDTVDISIKIDNNTQKPLGSFDAYYLKPVINEEVQISFYYNSETDRYIANLPIDSSFPNGEYIIEMLKFKASDMNIYSTLFNRYNPQGPYYEEESEYSYDFRPFTFNVHGINEDTTPPIIDRNSINVSKRKVLTGKDVTYSVKVTDDNTLKSVQIRLYNQKTGSDSGDIEMNYNNITKQYEATSYLPYIYNSSPGLWKIKYIRACDTNNNYSIVSDNLDDYSVYLYDYGESNPTINTDGISLTKNNLTANDETVLNLVMGDKLDIVEATVYYKIGDIIKPFEATFDSVYSSNNNQGIIETINNYKVHIAFDDYGENGTWMIDRIEITNSQNQEKTFYNKYIYNGSEYDLSRGDFTVSGLTLDHDLPVLDEYSISDVHAFLGEKIKLSLKVSDTISGIKSVKVNYSLPNNSKNDYILNCDNDGLCIYEFEYNDISEKGYYQINSITIEDNAENVNVLSLYGYGHALSFTFTGNKQILYPPKYLEQNSTYEIQAINTNTGEILKGCDWSRYDIDLSLSYWLGINLMNTRGPGSGKLVLICDDGDYFKILDQMNIIVVDDTVEVNEKKNFVNSIQTEYGDIEWEIDDETVLRKTGKTGRTVTDNTYLHYVEVEGLKSGVATLTLKSSAGTIIESFIIIVKSDEPEFTLTSQEESISVKKGSNKNINIDMNPFDERKYSNIVYYSSDINIAKVDANGVVTGVSGGSTTITARIKNTDIKVEIPVNVLVETESISLNAENITLNVIDESNETFQIIYNIFPIDASNKNVHFSSSDEDIIRVSNTGLITAVRNGTAKVIVTADDEHSQAEMNVTVEGLTQTNIEFLQIEVNDQNYTSGIITPQVVIYDRTYKLQEGVDYNLESDSCINVGTCYFTIKGIGNYKGQLDRSFNIVTTDIDQVTVSGLENKLFEGTKTTQNLKLTYKGNTLIEGVHYSVVFKDNIYPGTARAIIRGIGSFTGSVTKKYKIYQRKIGSATLEGLTDAEYTGKKTSLNLRLSYNGMILKEGIDYTVVFKDNINVGTARIIIRGMGNWSGEWKKAYRVIPKGTTITTVSSKTGGFSIKWVKQDIQTDGYIIEYSDNSLFTNSQKIKLGVNYTGRTVTGLSKGKTYYIRMRTYKDIDGTRYFSKYSNTKAVIIK